MLHTQRAAILRAAAKVMAENEEPVAIEVIRSHLTSIQGAFATIAAAEAQMSAAAESLSAAMSGLSETMMSPELPEEDKAKITDMVEPLLVQDPTLEASAEVVEAFNAAFPPVVDELPPEEGTEVPANAEGAFIGHTESLNAEKRKVVEEDIEKDLGKKFGTFRVGEHVSVEGSRWMVHRGRKNGKEWVYDLYSRQTGQHMRDSDPDSWTSVTAVAAKALVQHGLRKMSTFTGDFVSGIGRSALFVGSNGKEVVIRSSRMTITDGEGKVLHATRKVEQ